MAERFDLKLSCNRLALLRSPAMAEAESLYKHANNRDVWITLRDGMPYPYSPEDAVRWVERVQDQQPRVSFVIDLNGEAIGAIGLVLGCDIERCSAEVGYWLGADHWGRGIATAALQRICRYAFEDLGLLRVFATPIVWNPASFRVLEKAGFEREGIMRNACIKDGKVMDMALYGKVREEVEVERQSESG
ncbi:MAG: GNAT family protein [Candidatus Cybelea sp.]|jgi:ribosomal-protein-alanine N-acetyltransferase